MSFDKSRNTSKAVHSTTVTDGTAEFPQSQLQGIYIGVIKKIIFTSRNGHVKVYIPDFGGDPDQQTSWRDVVYASPFMGSTTGGWPSDVNSTYQDNTFTNSTQSYGFYMTPPDVGNEVLCMFSPNRLEGYWFACVNSSRTRQMIPAIGAVRYNLVEPESIPEYLQPYIDPSWNYPVAETVVNLPESENVLDPSTFPKPLHENLTLQYLIQGLISDNARGPITSSSQRDPVSSAFGFSSPGRPIENQDPAYNEDLRNAILTGEFNPNDLAVTARYQGHSFVMDDGDQFGNNNLVRLRTSAGHQIMMNDTEGFIYIANSVGTAWVELTAGGDILVYGANDLAIRTAGNIMMTSDRNIKFDAFENFQISASQIQFQSKIFQVKADVGLDIYGTNAIIKAPSSLTMATKGTMRLAGKKIFSSKIDTTPASVPPLELKSPLPLTTYYVPDAQLAELLWFSQPESYQSINPVVPTHEPYIRGSLATAQAQQEAASDIFEEDLNGNLIDPPLYENDELIGLRDIDQIELTGEAPESFFIDQDIAFEAIGLLDVDDVTALNAQISYNESGGDYEFINETDQTVGKYGFDTMDLIEAGYVKDGTPDTIEALQNSNNWRGFENISSLNDFVAAPGAQEKLQNDLMKKTYNALMSTGVIKKSSPIGTIAGLVNAALKSDVNSVVKYVTKGILPSQNGNALTTAYRRGQYSINSRQRNR